MAKTRAIMTDTERERIAELEDVEEIKRYQAISRVRRRINEELTFDVELLQEHAPELYDELVEVVCPEGEVAHTSPEPESDRSEVSDESDGPQGPPDEEQATRDVREVLEASHWRPGQNREGREERLHAAVKALEFLRDRGEAEKADFLEELHPTHAPEGQNEDTFWRKVVRGSEEQGTGALGVARNAGLVEREHGPPHIYRWVRI